MSAAVKGLAFIDSETTGLSADALAWEIGVLFRDGIAPDPTYMSVLIQIEGFFPEMFEPGALEVAGFSERYGKTPGAVMLSAAEAARFLHDILDRSHLVGANPAYDAGVIGSLLRSHGYKPSWHFRLIDVEAMAMGALGLAVPKGLQGTARALGLDFDAEDMHTAMGDADLARRIYDQIIWKERP